MSGASDEGFITTVLPASRAPAAGPPDSAIGKLNGLMTAHTPCGFSTLRVCSSGESEPIGCTKPSWRSMVSP